MNCQQCKSTFRLHINSRRINAAGIEVIGYMCAECKKKRRDTEYFAKHGKERVKISASKDCNHCGATDDLIVYSKRQLKDGSMSEYIRCRTCQRETQRKRDSTARGRILQAIRAKRTRAKADYKVKSNARTIARRKVPIQPCEVCGTTERVDRHHPDYTKPTQVMFLCKIHHAEWHKNNEVIHAAL